MIAPAAIRLAESPACDRPPATPLPAVLLLLAAVLAVASRCPAAETGEKPLQRFRQTQPHMGATFEIILYANEQETAQRAFDAAFARIDQLNNLMSDYDPDSELSRLGRSSPHSQPVPISDDLLRVLAHAQTLSGKTGGAFDVTVGPLTRLWRRARRQRRLPDSKRLERARSAVGYQHLRLDVQAGTAQLLRAEMRLDLGGIAKGYAADATLRVLSEHGIRRALVNAGGDIATSGAPPDQPGWKIGIAPLQPKTPPDRFLSVCNKAVATSGDAWQFVEIDDRRYSHIIDPRTGTGLTQRSSVTVVAGDCTTADGWASALSVLGPKRGLAMIEHVPHAAAFIVLVEDDQVRTYESSGFEDLPEVEQE